ncbi:MAG: hypothetical protein JSW06_02940 [Thermoplasmatales archaeon]|nr:MAG: hypothetical protein JSW06_02940 [Thermoplasmatales archaeon]
MNNIKQFIYLDEYKMYSLSSQLFEGITDFLIDSKFEETEEQESLKQNEAYLRYLWIQGLHDGSSEVIYIPTEANLPILESVRKLRQRK